MPQDDNQDKIIDVEYTERKDPEKNGNRPVSANEHTWGIVCYITFIGLIVTIACVEKEKQTEYLKFHMNQSLVLCLFSLLCAVPFIGWIWAVFIFVVWLLSLIGACEDRMYKVPLLGNIHILN